MNTENILKCEWDKFLSINPRSKDKRICLSCTSKIEMLKLTRTLRKYEEEDNRNNGSAWWTANRLNYGHTVILHDTLNVSGSLRAFEGLFFCLSSFPRALRLS